MDVPEILVGKRIGETLATLNHLNLNIRHTFIEKYLKFSKVKFSENEENYPKPPHRPIYAVLLTVSKQKKRNNRPFLQILNNNPRYKFHQEVYSLSVLINTGLRNAWEPWLSNIFKVKLKSLFGAYI